MSSIRRQLTLTLCVLIGGILAATAIGAYLTMREVLLSGFDETLAAKGRALVTASEVDDGDFEIDLTVRDFAGFGEGGNDYFEIRRGDGSFFLESPSGDPVRMIGRAGDDIRPPADGSWEIGDMTLTDGRAARYYSQLIHPKDDKKGRFHDLYFIIASPSESVSRQLALLGLVLGASTSLGLLLLLPAVGIALRRGLQPIHRMTRELTAFRAGDTERRLEASALPEELKPVAEVLNEWLGRLADAFDRERRFTSDAAHELRTPLAEIRGMAELAAMDPADPATPARLQEMVDATDEMTTLIDKLAILARADSRRHVVNPERISLQDAIQETITRFHELSERRGLRVETEIAPVFVDADPLLLRAVLQNLLGNAMAHGPAGSLIEIHGDAAGLKVANAAPDLLDQDLLKLTDRFWRKSTARSEREHSGLGLSIVAACVRLHGWELAPSLVNGSLVMHVVFGSSPDSTGHAGCPRAGGSHG